VVWYLFIYGQFAATTVAGISPPSYKRLLSFSEFFNDEDNSVIRSAMDALRDLKKITLLTVIVLFLFAFFHLILDAPRT
jgi:hypothetical protein